MKSEIRIITEVDKTNKYNAFITKERYNSYTEVKDDLIAFLINLYPWLKWSTEIDHFNIDFEKMRETGISYEELDKHMKEVDKYIDAYNSFRTKPMKEIMLKKS